MDNKNNEYKKTEKLWQRIAIIAGAFSFIICLLIVLNFFQINKSDPVNTAILDQLVERLSQDPSDNALREEIRALDLLARKAYFSSQWQIRTGGYLMLMGVAVVIIAMQMIIGMRKKDPVLSDEADESLLLRQKITRRWISIGGVSVVTAALIFAFLSHRNLEDKFNRAANPGIDNVKTQNQDFEESASEPTEGINDTTLVDKSDDLAMPQVDSIVEANPGPVQESKSEAKVVSATNSQAPSGILEKFPNFRGPGGNGICDQKNIPVHWDGASGENILWKKAIPLKGFNSPVIWGDRLYLSGAEGNKREVYALDRHTGEILWTAAVTNVPGSPAQPPEVANYTGHAAPTMATDGIRLFAIFANGDMVALDLEGNSIWSKNLGVPVNHYGYSSSLLVYKDKVIVQYDQKNSAQVMALSVNTGDKLWSTKRDVKISWASPVIVNTGSRNELLLAAEPLVISYNPETGEELWRSDGVSGEVGPSVAYADGIVFAVNDYSRLVAIKIGNEPEILWEDEEYLSDVPSPVATKDVLIVPTSYGMIACYDTKTGSKYWEHEAENTIYASPLISEGKVYLVDKQGVTYIFKADKTFESIGTPQLGEKIVCTPAFANGRIYLRGYDNLYCIGN